MNSLIQKLFPNREKKHQEIEEIKSQLMQDKKDTLSSLKKVNKTFRLTIDSGQIDVIIKDISDITKQK